MAERKLVVRGIAQPRELVVVDGLATPSGVAGPRRIAQLRHHRVRREQRVMALARQAGEAAPAVGARVRDDGGAHCIEIDVAAGREQMAIVVDQARLVATFPQRPVLRLLMETNGLTQAELGVDLGGQSVVSAVLNGNRAINARQASAPVERFGVSPAAFIA